MEARATMPSCLVSSSSAGRDARKHRREDRSWGAVVGPLSGIGYAGDMSVRTTYPSAQPCPCGSGAAAGACCLSLAGTWRKTPRDLAPPGPATGTSHPKCYLSATRNCSDDISAEHYISKSVLAELERNGTSKIAGLPWQNPRTFSVVGTGRLVSKVLCKRHNEALSPLDEEAGRLIETIGNYDRGFNQENPRADITVLCGEELEKWMLKTTCGMVAAKQTARDGVNYNSDISEVWVSILSGQASWPALWGLYAAVPTGVAYHSSSFSFRPFTHPGTGRVLATEMILNGMMFYLLLGRPDSPSAWGVYRPRTLILEQDAVQKFIEISWLDTRYDEYIRFSRVGKYDGPPPDWAPWAQEG